MNSMNTTLYPPHYILDPLDEEIRGAITLCSINGRSSEASDETSTTTDQEEKNTEDPVEELVWKNPPPAYFNNIPQRKPAPPAKWRYFGGLRSWICRDDRVNYEDNFAGVSLLISKPRTPDDKYSNVSTCAVCLDSFSDNDVYSQPRVLWCGHVFCSTCIAHWVEKSAGPLVHCECGKCRVVSCPLCRKEMWESCTRDVSRVVRYHELVTRAVQNASWMNRAVDKLRSQPKERLDRGIRYYHRSSSALEDENVWYQLGHGSGTVIQDARSAPPEWWWSTRRAVLLSWTQMVRLGIHVPRRRRWGNTGSHFLEGITEQHIDSDADDEASEGEENSSDETSEGFELYSSPSEEDSSHVFSEDLELYVSPGEDQDGLSDGLADSPSEEEYGSAHETSEQEDEPAAEPAEEEGSTPDSASEEEAVEPVYDLEIRANVSPELVTLFRTRDRFLHGSIRYADILELRRILTGLERTLSS
ncbi:hypothetical protein M501DRAFT_1059279 [Patellaria atrata CBS 101060]|uniref:RING-type domain-containing protein n=1 Tax=Patellaria atrata CBS 101060 TaxID=1346257 RepID=A0A9P4S730_9PEZI|nr:hypothetical protein M501DRAFT_1059279 [Patellaria atrata CBS 101060]